MIRHRVWLAEEEGCPHTSPGGSGGSSPPPKGAAPGRLPGRPGKRGEGVVGSCVRVEGGFGLG